MQAELDAREKPGKWVVKGENRSVSGSYRSLRRLRQEAAAEAAAARAPQALREDRTQTLFTEEGGNNLGTTSLDRTTGEMKTFKQISR